MESYTQETSFTAHDNTKIDVIYTNEKDTVVWFLGMYEECLEKDEDKFVRLDLEYTKEEEYFENEVTVVQLAMRQHVLVYYYSWFVHLISLVYHFQGFLTFNGHLYDFNQLILPLLNSLSPKFAQMLFSQIMQSFQMLILHLLNYVSTKLIMTI